EGLFDTLFVYENYPVSRESGQNCGLDMECISTFEKTEYGLTLSVIPGTQLKIKLTYKGTLFDQKQVEMLGEQIKVLAHNVMLDPDQCLGNISLLEEKVCAKNNLDSTVKNSSFFNQSLGHLFNSR